MKNIFILESLSINQRFSMNIDFTTIAIKRGILFCLIIIFPELIFSQSVSVGLGSYSTQLPSGAVGPQYANGASVSPKVSSDFSKPIQTNDFWSSLIYPFYGDPHSNAIYAHPLLFKARNNGLQMGYTPNHVIAGADYLYPFSNQLTVSVSGMNASKTVTQNYGDWTVTALWEDGDKSMKATFGHGLPFAYFEINGGDAQITPNSAITLWYRMGEVLGITVDGRHYGIFAPIGSTWNEGNFLSSSLAGKNFLSIALLPDTQLSTIQLYRKHAYAFVTNSEVSWEYEESSAQLKTTYTYQTDLKETEDETLVNETISALYRHLWIYADVPMTSLEYKSPRGIMKVAEGNQFSTQITFSGIVPSLPDEGDYSKTVLLDMVKEVAKESLPTGPSYENGKQMNRFAQLIPIAEQLGAITERDYFISQLKKRLEDWLTAGGTQQYVYNEKWDVLTGYPSGYGADNQINDHHFHASYAIISAAFIAQYDPEWSKQENWGAMINLLIKDSNNWDRTDSRFPFLRTHDAYAGHSWAAGHGDFGDGNNQESSSESMNFATAVFLWGVSTGQKEVRDLGIFLHANEMIAIENYWFDVHEQVFPSNYDKVALGMVWGGKGVHSTWFGANPEFIHGINMLPLSSGSMYLGRHPEYVIKNFEEIVSELSSQPTVWKDVIWQYLALSDASRAFSLYFADQNYQPFDGESRAHTLHWLGNLKKMGRPDTTTTANIPTYSVYLNALNEKTYVAYNPDSESKTVVFSDGFSFDVPAGKMKSQSTNPTSSEGPVAILSSDKTRGKAPFTIHLSAENSFDRNQLPLSFLWDLGDGTQSEESKFEKVYEEPGEYKIKLTVSNSNNELSSDSLIVQVLSSGSPFSGTPVKIPGKIEAEQYDVGGEGIAYHDVDPNNIGQAFRLDEGVDLEAANDGGYDVYWMVAGEWIEYTFESDESAEFDISSYVSTVPGFGNFTLFIDNEPISDKTYVLNTGGWQNWTPITIKNVFIEAGVHILRIEIDSDSDKSGWLFSLNSFQFTKVQGTSIEQSEQQPDEITLYQNYPNPFNPTTTISFYLPTASDVVLTIYSGIGQKIGTVVASSLSAGFHSYPYDASNLSSGMYLYELQTNENRIIKKLMLIK